MLKHPLQIQKWNFFP